MDNISSNLFKKIYWKNFIFLEEEFLQTEKFVSFDACNYSTYSAVYLKLLLELGSEIDILAKLFCCVRCGRDDVSTIDQYKECILRNVPDFEYVSVISESLREIPWQNMSLRSPYWWTAYNKVKHERFAVGEIGGVRQEYYKFANLENVVKALMGLYQLEIYVLNCLVKRENKKEGFSFLKSSLFSLDGFGWISGSFHKEGGVFFQEGDIIFDGGLPSVELN